MINPNGGSDHVQPSEALKYFSDCANRFVSYHNHKETSAWAAVVLWYLLLFGPFSADLLRWSSWAMVNAIVMTIGVLAVGAVAGRYVSVQLDLRSHTADLVAAFYKLCAATLNGRPFVAADFKVEQRPGIRDSHYLPSSVLTVVAEMEKADRGVRTKLSRLALLLMGLAAGLVIVRVWSQWLGIIRALLRT